MEKKKKDIILGIFLSVAVLVTSFGVSPICASALSGDMIAPYTIGSVSVYLEKKTSNTLSYRVKGATNEAMSSSVTAKIILQKNESNKWVDKQTITKTEKNIKMFDFTDTIDVKSYGAGSYRIQVTVSDVYNGITHTVGPYNSGTVMN